MPRSPSAYSWPRRDAETQVFTVGVWNPDRVHWVPALERAVEGGSIGGAETASTLVRLDGDDIRFVNARCHGTTREHIRSSLKQGFNQQGHQYCTFSTLPRWGRMIGD